MYRQHIDTAKEKMQKTVTVVKKELSTMRAGRANPQILDRVLVDYYGTPTPINQIGNISSPEPRMLVISLWETKMIPVVEKAIQKSDIGINPTNDGKVIRLLVPELTEERRKDLVKQVKKYGEDAKVAIRNIRRDAMDKFKAAIAATAADGPVTILNAECVAKSYPKFWEEYKRLGGKYE